MCDNMDLYVTKASVRLQLAAKPLDGRSFPYHALHGNRLRSIVGGTDYLIMCLNHTVDESKWRMYWLVGFTWVRARVCFTAKAGVRIRIKVKVIHDSHCMSTIFSREW